MKKTETLYSYLYKKSNKMWAVKYKFHKKDAYKNTSLGTTTATTMTMAATSTTKKEKKKAKDNN